MDISVSYNISEDQQIDKLATALNALTRRKILRLVGEKSYSVMQLAQILNISVSTMTFHLKLLHDAHLIKVLPNPNKKGNEKIVSQDIAMVNMSFVAPLNFETREYTEDVPIGSYTAYDISAPCGLVKADGLILVHDNPSVFSSPQRVHAVILSFSKGYVEYSLPAFAFKDKKIESFTFSLELCSECPNYNNDWKSDITFWLNNTEICTFRSMGDYGDRRGKYTPPHWPANATQYGMLKKIRVDNIGTHIDENLASEVNLSALKLSDKDLITLRIGIKDTARYVGGCNIFGKHSGDTDQDIFVHVVYREPI